MIHDMRCAPLFFFLLLSALWLSGCAASSGFTVKSLAKTDIDDVADIHLHQVKKLLKVLTVKLYKINPNELKKAPNQTIGRRMKAIFRCPPLPRYKEIRYKTGTGAMLLAFEPDFKGDRVFALMYGLYTMILRSYNDRCQMFLLDYLNQQSLYNSARNIEILVWRLK
jgi:hypothetical protein